MAIVAQLLLLLLLEERREGEARERRGEEREEKKREGEKGRGVEVRTYSLEGTRASVSISTPALQRDINKLFISIKQHKIKRNETNRIVSRKSNKINK